MDRAKTSLAVRLEASEACTVIVNAPVVVAVPLINPDDERFNPFGRFPLVRLQL